TTRPSGLRLALFSALAIALFNVLLTRNAAFLGVKASRSRAAETGRPWISRVTSRALNGEIRAYLYVDLTSMCSQKQNVKKVTKLTGNSPSANFLTLLKFWFLSHFKLTFPCASTWRRSPTLILSFLESIS